MKRTLAQALAGLVGARARCLQSNSMHWATKHEEKIESLIDENLPHGSGIDGDQTFDFWESSEDKLVINSAYHIMDDNGFYIGWLDFKVVVTASLQFVVDVDIEFEAASFALDIDVEPETESEVDECYFDTLGDYLADSFAEAFLKEDETYG